MWEVCGKTSIETVKKLRGTEISETTGFWDFSSSGVEWIQSKYSLPQRKGWFPLVQCDPDLSHMRSAADFISMTITDRWTACVWKLLTPVKPQDPIPHTCPQTTPLSAVWPPLNFKGFDLFAITKTLGELVLLSVPAHPAASHIMLYSYCHMV